MSYFTNTARERIHPAFADGFGAAGPQAQVLVTHGLARVTLPSLYTGPMGVAFYKMNGLGNDFVVVDARARKIPFGPDAARRIGDRHRGVGFDQLLSIEPANGAGDAVMRIWNPDGSLAEACGNGTRCVADLLMTESKKTVVTLSTAGGLLSCVREADGREAADVIGNDVGAAIDECRCA